VHRSGLFLLLLDIVGKAFKMFYNFDIILPVILSWPFPFVDKSLQKQLS